MIFRKTVRQVLEGTGWDKFVEEHDTFRQYLNMYGGWMKCKFPAVLKREATYYDLHQKLTCGYQFIIFQENQILPEFYRMNPFEGALCLCYKNSNSPKVEIFEYSVEVTQQPIFVLDLSLLVNHFEKFNISKMDGTLSRIEYPEALCCHDNLIAVSKTPLRFDVPLIIIYYSPTTQNDLSNHLT